MQHQLFHSLLQNPDDADLILHTEVRCISKGKVLDTFIHLIEEIKSYLASKNQIFLKLTDPLRLADLSFVTDIMEKLNNLNLELQGKVKHVAKMIVAINSFRAQLVLWISHLKMKSLVHFPNMKK